MDWRKNSPSKLTNTSLDISLVLSSPTIRASPTMPLQVVRCHSVSRPPRPFSYQGHLLHVSQSLALLGSADFCWLTRLERLPEPPRENPQRIQIPWSSKTFSQSACYECERFASHRSLLSQRRVLTLKPWLVTGPLEMVALPDPPGAWSIVDIDSTCTQVLEFGTVKCHHKPLS